MADGWLRKYSNDMKLEIDVDSAGTANYHVGSKPDHRMRKWSLEAGVSIDELSARQFNVRDFDEFDIIFAMDQSNQKNILSLARNETDKAKVRLYLNELHPNQDMEVPDPYYGTDTDFKDVIQLLKEATEAFINNEFKNR
jgi:protein-tyrosine phosphatase